MVVGSQQSHDRVGLVADRSNLGQPGHCRVDVEEVGDPAGRWGVQDDGVVRVGRVLDLPPHRLVHLAGEQHVAQPGRDRGGEVNGPEAVKGPARQC